MHNSYHKRLDENTDNTLHAHDEDRFRAFLIGGSWAITNCVLGLDGEEETAGKGVDVIEARNWGGGIRWWWVEIAMGKDDKPPDESEE